MYVCVCGYEYMSICVCIRTYVIMCVQICMSSFVYICGELCTQYNCIHVCTCVSMYIYVIKRNKALRYAVARRTHDFELLSGARLRAAGEHNPTVFEEHFGGAL